MKRPAPFPDRNDRTPPERPVTGTSTCSSVWRAIRVLVFATLVTTWIDDAAAEWKWPLSSGSSAQPPHPAVVRVIVDEPEGISQGSGTLVDVRDQFALVVTNWHVVRDASGAINVIFPDGFRSAARVLKVDRDWDLAALLIWRPLVSPVPLAAQAPRPGDPLVIAGYGPGPYREAAGRCTQYVAPSQRHPFEMVEVAATARQGDSGGPIFNAAGELAGVLFGSGGGTTSGSYAGRVHEFLATAWPPEAPVNGAASVEGLARLPSPTSESPGLQPLPQGNRAPGYAEVAQMAPLPAAGTPSQDPPQFRADGPAPNASTADVARVHTSTFTWQDIAGESAFQQVKTVLALIGALAIFLQLTRLTAPRT